jgi:copper(I)-binding protein
MLTPVRACRRTVQSHHVSRSSTITALLPVLLLAAHAAHAVSAESTEHITLEHAWVRALPPTQSSTAAYLRVINRGKDTVRITGAEASGAGRVALHQSRSEDGIMRMLPVSELPLAPGASAELEPGGLHLMLQDLEHMPAPGDSVRLCLLSKRGTRSCIDAEVRRTAPSGHDHAH